MNTFQRKIAAIKLGLKSIQPDDTFVVSYPKSGNTWVRFILSNLLSDQNITLKNIDEYVPDCYNFKSIINKTLSKRFIKTHDCHLSSFPKSIYIYRDYRDVLVSYYHYQVGLGEFTGNLSSFIRQENSGFGSWTNHINYALAFKQKHPARILMLSYEDLLKNTSSNIDKIAQFCSILPLKSTSEIEQICSFDSLKENEAINGRTFDKNEITFFRKGTIGQWRNELSEEDQNWLTNKYKTTLKQLGYL